uniref:Sulfatase N-terminal domain-containing protein n=1 Tax=Haptolina brevifila TaxID=156173 RepID=A0A7S2IR02_9EUKA|mmetsp:Transcript_69746/g.138276  ORF Transcript_69746/g.138276 Transcript_69746/m.138276 type:complete len:625 (+) Transcript_69746:148-2022(+)
MLQETQQEPAAVRHDSTLPHILMVLVDDWGWANAGWHRNYTAPGGLHVPPTPEVDTPKLDSLVHQGIELDRHYVFKYCSPSRAALQSGRAPPHVTTLGTDPGTRNQKDPDSGYAGIPRNMTGIAAKLASVGYKTAVFGKWDVGMATPDHTPRGRGYQRGLTYFHHQNDYWSMFYGWSPLANGSYVPGCPRYPGAGPDDMQPITDLWLTGTSANGDVWERPAYGYNGSCIGLMPDGGRPPQCTPGPQGDGWFGGYEDALLERELMQTIREHDVTLPLFAFWSPHIAHVPMQVPETYFRKFGFIAPTDRSTHERQRYHAMIAMLDDMVGNVTSLLQQKRMWQSTLMVLTTDNGGPIYQRGAGGGNNYPLRGGKGSNWEGGIRVNAFVSGGLIPAARRGTRFDGLVAIWDWYATFASLAGVTSIDERAAQAGLPPIDSIDMSAALGLGGSLRGSGAKAGTSPRTQLLIGTEPRPTNLSSAPLCASYAATTLYDEGDGVVLPPANGRCTTISGLLVDEGASGLWKLLTGTIAQAVYSGPHTPNASTEAGEPASYYKSLCPHGCLFELRGDPLETHDLASEHPQKRAELWTKLETAQGTAFNPDRGVRDPVACDTALHRYGGFWGPFVD